MYRFWCWLIQMSDADHICNAQDAISVTFTTHELSPVRWISLWNNTNIESALKLEKGENSSTFIHSYFVWLSFQIFPFRLRAKATQSKPIFIDKKTPFSSCYTFFVYKIFFYRFLFIGKHDVVFSHHDTKNVIFRFWYTANWLTIGKKVKREIFVVAIPLSDFLYFCCCSGIPCIMLTSMKRVSTLAYRDSTCLFFFPYLFCPLSLTKTFYLNGEIKRITWNHFIKRNQWFCRQKHTRHWWREKNTKQTFTCASSTFTSRLASIFGNFVPYKNSSKKHNCMWWISLGWFCSLARCTSIKFRDHDLNVTTARFSNEHVFLPFSSLSFFPRIFINTSNDCARFLKKRRHYNCLASKNPRLARINICFSNLLLLFLFYFVLKYAK